MTKIDLFLDDFLEALGAFNGIKLATLLSYRDGHTLVLVKQLKKMHNTSNYISARIPAPWSSLVELHFELIRHLNEPLEIASLQNNLAQNFHAQVAQSENRWIIPIMIMINQELQISSSLADESLLRSGSGINPDNLEKAARTMNKAFSLCATDRYSVLEESRKWGTYAIVNILFKTYFKLSSTNLCSTILRSLSSADLPDLDEYPKADQVTFKYYTGVLSFQNEKFEQAATDLLFAIRHGSVEEEECTMHNKALILRFLIPTQLVRGILASDELFTKFESLAVYRSITAAIKEGNLKKFDEVFEASQTLLIRWGTWLIIERSRLLVVRQLFRKVWMCLDNPSRLSLSILQKSVCFSTKSNVDNIPEEQVVCLVVNLIAQGYMKGYISYERSTVVLSNKDPFPKLSK